MSRQILLIVLGCILLIIAIFIYMRSSKDDEYDVIEIDDVLAPEECDQLIEYHRNKLEESTIVGESGFDKSKDRTSSQAWLYKNNTELEHISSKLYKLASKLSGVFKDALLEDIQVACYRESQEYKPHYDACVTPKYCNSPHKIYRKATLLVYLNDEFDGGETHFPLIDKRVVPRKGKAVFFFNTNDNNAEIHKSLHGGLPVKSGEKWIANVWIKFK